MHKFMQVGKGHTNLKCVVPRLRLLWPKYVFEMYSESPGDNNNIDLSGGLGSSTEIISKSWKRRRVFGGWEGEEKMDYGSI